MTPLRALVPCSALVFLASACPGGDANSTSTGITGADVTTAGESTTLEPDDEGESETRSVDPSPSEADSTAAGESSTTDDSDSDSDDPGVAQCDIFAQDCPDGQKCMPWARDGGNAWNATRCSPVVGAPGQVGDSCLVEGSGVSGIDDCDVGLVCYNVDATTNQGTCYEACRGSAGSPVCEGADTVCAIYNDGVLPLCFVECDPLSQDCPGTELCVASPNNNAFVCILDSLPNAPGGYAEPCEFANACDPGLFCAGPAAVPGCTNGGGCCSEFCDLRDEEPSSGCSGVGDGQVCLAWWVDAAPPGYEGVGFCGTPS